MTLPYTHLSLAERREIARMHASKIPISVIADRLQRHQSTNHREIKRKWVLDQEPLYRGYYHVAAGTQALTPGPASGPEQTLPQAGARGSCYGPPQEWRAARADRWSPAGIPGA